MRRLAIGLGMAFSLFCCSNIALASSIENENLNARIRALQERLKEFQKREYKDHEEKIIAEEEAIDLILEEDSILPEPDKIEEPIDTETAEKRLDDFEKRSDVAVTVLFHDNDTSESYGAIKNFALIEPPKIIIDDGQDDKQQFYETLRRKVFQATRNARQNNVERHHMLASLDSLN